MSIYSDALTALQRVGLTGGDLTHVEKRNLLAVVRARDPEVTATNTVVDAEAALIEAQCVILDGEAEPAPTAATAIRASVAAIVAAKPVSSGLVLNPVIDGY